MAYSLWLIALLLVLWLTAYGSTPHYLLPSNYYLLTGGVQDPALLEHKNLLTVPIIVEIFVTTIRDDNLVLDL